MTKENFEEFSKKLNASNHFLANFLTFPPHLAVKFLRQHYNLTQKELSEILDLSESTIISAENARRPITEQYLNALMEKLFVPEIFIQIIHNNLPAQECQPENKLRVGSKPIGEVVDKIVLDIQNKQLEAFTKSKSRMYSILATAHGSEKDSKFTYRIVETARLNIYDKFRAGWPNFRPTEFVVAICDRYEDAEAKLTHLTLNYSEWELK